MCVPRRGEQRCRLPLVDEATLVEHDHVFTVPRDDPEVVRNQQQGRIVPNVLKQIQDLGLHCYVERGRGLVGDQQVRLGNQRRGQHDALAHASR